jgi:hypothetical protein
MTQPLTKHRANAKLLLALVLFCGMNSCKKNDLLQKTSSESNEEMSQKTTQESAAMVYQWYRYIAMLQRPYNPQPAVLSQNRHFAFIGVGLFEAVHPGLKEPVA